MQRRRNNGVRLRHRNGEEQPEVDDDTLQRMSRLEGILDVLKIWIPTIFFGILSIVVVLLIWQFRSLDTRLENISRKIEAIPGELQDLATTIANHVTAARSGPIVIYPERESETEKGRTPDP